MYTRIFRILVGLISSCIGLAMSHAATNFEVASHVVMTGSNSDVRFDVAPALHGYSTNPATLDTQEMKLEGAFYIRGIGWALLSSGATHQVKMVCSQSVNQLTNPCALSGLAWSEHIGDIRFDSIIYDPSNGKLTGNATSYAGNISMNNIVIARLAPASITISTQTANQHATIDIANASQYQGSPNPWKMILSVEGMSQMLVSNNGTFDDVDISLAGQYIITIEDPNGSITRGIILDVTSNIASTSLVGGTFYAKTFCQSNTSSLKCPDGSDRQATSYNQSPSGGVFANAIGVYNIEIHLRDTYGNRVETGNLAIQYDATVKKLQYDFGGELSLDGDAFLMDGTPNPLGRKYMGLHGIDVIKYSIGSMSPTNTDNIVKLKNIRYNTGSHSSPIEIIGGGSNISFDAPYTVNIQENPPIYANHPHTFDINLTRDDVDHGPSQISVSMQFVTNGTPDGSWQNFSQNICSIDEYDARCNIGENITAPFVSKEIGTSTQISATYATLLDASSTTTRIDGFVHYKIGGENILHSIAPANLMAAKEIPKRYKILGKSSQYLNTGQQRANIINDIRKNTAILSRNRNAYDDVEYIVHHGDYTLSDEDIFVGSSSSVSKKSLIVIAGDIHINTNIQSREYPITLVAIADNNTGGNIRISQNVTDIHALLIAQRSVISATSQKQLVIQGGIISANIPTEVPPTQCPYYVTTNCDPATYDLAGQRSGFASSTNESDKSLNPLANTHQKIPVIIAPDTRLLQYPPIILQKQQ